MTNDTYPSVRSSAWDGWAADLLGAQLTVTSDRHHLGPAVLASLGVRRNPRRAQLVVSRVLGKHVVVRGEVACAAGAALACEVRARLSGVSAGLLPANVLSDPTVAAGWLVSLPVVAPDPTVVVVGFCETATGLGHLVADQLGASYVHTTRDERRPRTPSHAGSPATGRGLGLEGEVWVRFDEPHSHAPAHLLPASARRLFDDATTVVLVDDELSTGTTTANLIGALSEELPGRLFVVASLIDLRPDPGPAGGFASDALAAVPAVSLLRCRLEVDGVAAARSYAAVSAVPVPVVSQVAAQSPSLVVRLTMPAARSGVDAAEHVRVDAAVDAAAAALPRWVGRRVLVVGTEESMYLPVRLAARLGAVVQSSTRSPVVAGDFDEPYPVRSAVTFPSCYDQDVPAYLYNLDGASSSGGFDAVVVVTDDVTFGSGVLAAPGGMFAALTEHVLAPGGPAGAPADLVVVVTTEPSPAATPAAPPFTASSFTVSGRRPAPAALPLRGPVFSTYLPGDVGWLLDDVSALPLERPVEDRETAIQLGREHYADSLPVEYSPTAEYVALFDAALKENATAVSWAAARVTADLHAEYGPDAVLVSLARAGVPAGIWLRRLAERYFGAHWPHFAVSIVRGRGLDEQALAWLTGRFDPGRLVFVDAWTGKGAIRGELTDALTRASTALGVRVPDALAVLADPAGVADWAGTGEDLLVPSACLNATVSGLVSRTVLPQSSGALHGAKFYPELAGVDRSLELVEVVLGAAPSSAPLGAGRLVPSWRGVETVARLRERFRLPSEHLVKPGVGETTRVLLRRVPWQVLVHPDFAADPGLAHVRALAAERGVPVVVADTGPYRCVGLVRPAERGDV